jgi:hypothetical protein
VATRHGKGRLTWNTAETCPARSICMHLAPSPTPPSSAFSLPPDEHSTRHCAPRAVTHSQETSGPCRNPWTSLCTQKGRLPSPARAPASRRAGRSSRPRPTVRAKSRRQAWSTRDACTCEREGREGVRLKEEAWEGMRSSGSICGGRWGGVGWVGWGVHVVSGSSDSEMTVQSVLPPVA